MLKKIFSERDLKFFIFFTFFLTIIMQVFFIPRLPDKYFYDSNGILTIANGNYNPLYFDSSYLFTGNFFRIINIFGFTTFQQWSYFVSFILSVYIFAFLQKFHKINLAQMIFIYLTIGLANIYLFRISKDFIQLLFWLVMFLFLDRKMQYWFLVIAVFVVEGLVFRSYYLAMAVISSLIYFLIRFHKRGSNRTFKIIIFTFLFCFLGLFVLKIVSISNYYYLINLRYLINQNRLDSADAVTVIVDLIPNTNNVTIFMINYFINYIRILFPIELLTKGVKYIPFIIYQIMFSLFLIRSSSIVIKFKKKHYYLFVAVIFGYLSVANLFEPDFGSLVRHEITLFPIYLTLFIDVMKEGYYYESSKKY